ncbi:MAG: KpsF/GutQ family sugar-phosphate isomerase [Lentimonas sp.]
MNSIDDYKEAERIFNVEGAGLKQVLEQIAPTFSSAVELIRECQGKVVVVGIGKSGIIGHKIAATLASTGTSAVFLNAGDALHGDLGVVAPNDVVLMLSNSAKTAELVQMLPSLKSIGVKLIGMFGSSNTPLASKCDVILNLKVDQEGCPLGLAPMSSSTVALVTGDALASALMTSREFKSENFALYHPGGDLGRRLLLKVEDAMHPVGADFPTIAPEMSLREALAVMDRSNLGGVVVTEGAKVVGVFTDGDLRRSILKETVLEAVVGDLMTTDPICIPIDFALGQALDLMEQSGRKIYFAPVVDADRKLKGALRMHDIVSE